MDINNFGPFDVNVWGNASDVVTALSTIAATFGLYLTLGKQVKINKESLETSRIAMRPHFTLTDGSHGYIKVTCQNAHALNLRIPKTGTILSEELVQEYVFKEEIISTNIDFEFKLINIAPPGYILLTIFFEDEIGRKYKQNIINTKNRPVISHPIQIKGN